MMTVLSYWPREIPPMILAITLVYLVMTENFMICKLLLGGRGEVGMVNDYSSACIHCNFKKKDRNNSMCSLLWHKFK